MSKTQFEAWKETLTVDDLINWVCGDDNEINCEACPALFECTTCSEVLRQWANSEVTP